MSGSSSEPGDQSPSYYDVHYWIENAAVGQLQAQSHSLTMKNLFVRLNHQFSRP